MTKNVLPANGVKRGNAVCLDVVHTRVFAVGPNGGNPCPIIVSADKLIAPQMKALATQFGLDTAFILRPKSKTADIRLRYFVPDHEMGVSGHATIAALTVAQLNGQIRPGHVRVETISGIFRAESTRARSSIVVTLEQSRPVFRHPVILDFVARVLGIDKQQIVTSQGPVQSVSVSRPKLLIPLQDSRVLNGLKPNYEALWDLCENLQVTGLYPFTRHTNKADADVEARQFPLRAGFPEDAATGVAAAALGAYLAVYDRGRQGDHTFRVAQGYAMKRPSLIEVLTECREKKVTRVAIRGAAQVVSRNRLTQPIDDSKASNG